MKINLIVIFEAIIVIMISQLSNAVETQSTSDFTEIPELWTCGAEDWGPWYAQCAGSDDRPVAGKYSILLNYCQGAEHYLAFPKWRNANWDLSSAEYLEFKVRFPKGMTHRGPNPTIFLRNQDGPFIRIRPKDRASLFEKESDGEWQAVRVPLKANPEWETFNWLNASIKKIDFFELSFSGINSPKFAAHYVQVDEVRFTPNQLSYTPPNDQAADLDVLFIERTLTYERYTAPEYDGMDMMQANNKDKKHVPDKGEKVTFTAHIQNKGKAPSGGSFVWLVDGKEAGKGTIKELKTRERAEFTFSWEWDAADHDITFKLTPSAEDYCPKNNELTVRNNAIMWKHVIEKGTLAQAEEKTNMIGSYSFEDWLQGQARFMNQLFAESKYDFAPNGITARVMVGKIEYVEDGEIQRTCPSGPFQIGEQYPQYDGGRGCTMRDTFWNTSQQGPTFLNFLNFLGRPDGAWLHEMSHQNGIIDDYQFITEPEDNKVNGVGFNYDNRGLMGGGNISPHKNPDTLYSLYAPGDVFAYNYTKGKRRGYFGEYLYCIPVKNSLVIIGPDDKPAANAEIKVYQTSERKIDTTPEHEGKTDAQGKFPLANKPVKKPGVTETGCELHDNPFGQIHVVGFNGIFLVVVKTSDGKEMYGFCTVQEFNMEFAKGNKDKAEIPVKVKVKGDEKVYMGRL
jgi:hypothetical protein